MTVAYTTGGKLTNPVSDLSLARAYLDEPMEQYLDDDLRSVVFRVRWDLKDESTWVVEVIAERPLDAAELTRLSEWISGQNSDGLGEGFEQQPFAETGVGYSSDDDPYEEIEMSSFDWGTNPCTLTPA